MFKVIIGVPTVTQGVKDLALLQLWHRAQLQLGSDHWPRSFHMPQMQPKKKVFCFFLFFCFWGPHPWHMDIPRLGVNSELQLLTYATTTAMRDLTHICDLFHSSRQCWIPEPLSKARDQTQVFMETSRIPFHWATTGTSKKIFNKIKKLV